MTFAEEKERDLKELERAHGARFQFSSQTWTGIKDTSRVGLGMLDAGYENRRSIGLIVRLSQFGPVTPPTTNNTIVMDSLNWRVTENPEYDPEGISVRLPLVQSN